MAVLAIAITFSICNTSCSKSIKSDNTAASNETGGSTLDKFQVLGNTFFGIIGTAAPTSSTCTFTPPYSYSLYAASAVKSGVTSGAGIGKI